ncbi:lysophospholipid acyltransferase family protein [Daeguia caeni]|uniref:Lysophospholipid acyltransferase family protein n=1 Tax=Daeguia caeni TaxID=439612 RepID=A0ABV9H6B3_9HYPH
MENQEIPARSARKSRKDGIARRLWRRIREPLARSEVVKTALVQLIVAYMRLVDATSPRLKNSVRPEAVFPNFHPVILTFWHGQHLMTPMMRSDDMDIVGMFSRSADAEMNARVAEKLGLHIVRGSGGRRARTEPAKGGARALLQLKNALKAGRSVAMIADIAHGKARESGEGIILLAKLSGRPILPVALAYSRNYVLEKTWDRTTIPLPFGRSVIMCGEPVWVSPDADEAELEGKRMELTRQLNDATERAYAALGKAK